MVRLHTVETLIVKLEYPVKDRAALLRDAAVKGGRWPVGTRPSALGEWDLILMVKCGQDFLTKSTMRIFCLATNHDAQTHHRLP